MFGSLKTWGWVTLLLGVIEFVAAMSLFAGGGFGRFIAIFAAALVAIESLLAIPAYPFLSLAVFALSLWVIHGLAIYEPEAAAPAGPSASPQTRATAGAASAQR